MKQPSDEHRFFYVDETGDPSFYAKSRKLIVGQEGCSRTFGLGFLRTSKPEAIREASIDLRAGIASDCYLKDIPSIQKILRGFHAKNDCPEVRKAVFETLDRLEFSVQVIVARKLESLLVSRHKQSQDAFYNDLTSKLFERQLHLANENTITFARRGNKVNQHALRAAVDARIAAFRRRYINATTTFVTLETAYSADDPLLQAVDYALWTVQRAYEKGEMRYFEFLAPKFEMVWDIYDFARQQTKGTSLYSMRNTFHIEKVSLLG